MRPHRPAAERFLDAWEWAIILDVMRGLDADNAPLPPEREPDVAQKRLHNPSIEGGPRIQAAGCMAGDCCGAETAGRADGG